MSWKATFNGGEVKLDGSVVLIVTYAQTLAGNVPGSIFEEKMEFGPAAEVSQAIVKQKATDRVNALVGREAVMAGIEQLKGQDISTW